MMIDTHCHLDFKDFDSDRDEVIARAKDTGVERIINIGSSIDGSRRSVELARKYDMVYATVGVHPHEAVSVTDSTIADFKALAKDKKIVAVGEVGLDYYRNLSPKEVQISAFTKFIHLSLDLGLPLVIHARDAEREVLDILKKESGSGLRGVMHCFSGGTDFLKECVDLGLHISFTCNITFKNAANLREVAKAAPVERLLLETDAPFLAPREFRGKRNEPAYLKYLVAEWSRLSGLSGDDIERITTHNANILFGLGLADSTKIAYEIRGSLYLNITNNCTNVCDFCVRTKTQFVKGHNLKLEKEPSVEEIITAAGDPQKYVEIVFCGYGEPTTRLDDLKYIAKTLKEKGAKSIRLVTNGHGDLINKRTVAPELKGLVDKVSVSLNTDTEEKYNRSCKPKFGAGTYAAIQKFVRSCVSDRIEAEVTCLDLPGTDLAKCESIARSLGAKFRPRHLGVVG